MSNSLEEVQEITNRFADAAKLFGLKINISKTEFLFQPAPDKPYSMHPSASVNGTQLKEAATFPYLGSMISNTASADIEVERRVQAANKSFGDLQKRWKSITLLLLFHSSMPQRP